MRFRHVAFAAGLLLSCSVQAGPYTDDLSKCLVASTSHDDRMGFVRWMFAAMSLHPAVASLSKVTPQDVDEVNTQVGALFTRLLTVSCRVQAKLAFRYEGEIALQQSFSLFGQVAGKEIFSDPNVQRGMSGLKDHLDVKKLQELMPPSMVPPSPPPPPPLSPGSSAQD